MQSRPQPPFKHGKLPHFWSLVFTFILVFCFAQHGLAANSRLLATSGAGAIEAGAGGGITPWAVLSGYGVEREVGCALGASQVKSSDYRLRSTGLACTWSNRLELSWGYQALDLDGLIPLLGLPENQQLSQQMFSAKVRLHGDIVYSRFGQWSAGAVYKNQRDEWLARVAGAERISDIDYFLSGGKLFLHGPLGYMYYLNGTFRMTRANQIGLLGFGGDRGSRRKLNAELAAAVFPRRDLAFGIEYRQKPDNLSFAGEDDWFDLFAAWFPSKRITVVAAWAELGSIGTLKNQNGLFLSLTGNI